MRSLILVLVTAGLSFFAGYEFRKYSIETDNDSQNHVVEGEVSKTSSPTPSVVEEPVIPEVVAISEEPSKPQPLPSPQSLSDPTDFGLAARAAQKVVTLIDQQGREMVAEIIQANKSSLRVRRQVDYRVVDVPFDMLSREDRVFAEYLWEQNPTVVPLAQTASLEAGPMITQKELLNRISEEF